MPNSHTIFQYIEKYRNKANVVRQIHSEIAESNRKWDLGHTVATMALGAILTATGFMGTDRIYELFISANPTVQASHSSENKSVGSDIKNTEQDQLKKLPDTATNPLPKTALPEAGDDKLSGKKKFDFIFNFAALFLFITSTLNLIFRWKDEHTAHFQGVVKLTSYVNWIDEVKLLGINTLDRAALKEIRVRYQAIVDSLPPSDEKDYEKAKKSLNKKDKLKSHPSNTESAVSTSDQDEDLFHQLIEDSSILMEVLRVLRDTNKSLWLGGGAIRNQIWDQLTGRVTPHDDFDVIYFNSQNLEEASDKKIEMELSQKLPEKLKISVKNQARMHLLNGEPQRHALEEAISHWPEQATSIAVRMNDDGKLELIAPYGVSDIMNMIIRPTPSHEANRTSYNKRLETKNWQSHWPELTVRI